MIRQTKPSASKLERFVWREDMHPWHDVPLGAGLPHQVHAFVGTPNRGAAADQLISKFQRIRRECAILPPISYPAKYGFIPQTLERNGYPIDSLILTQSPPLFQPVLPVRPIGIVRLKGTPHSHNLICVYLEDPFYSAYRCVSNLPIYERRRLQWFFNDYQDLMDREIDVDSIQKAEVAQDYLRYCHTLYREKFQSTARE